MTTTRNGREYTGRDANVGLVPHTRAPGARPHALTPLHDREY